jgi:hypothetical protein
MVFKRNPFSYIITIHGVGGLELFHVLASAHVGFPNLGRIVVNADVRLYVLCHCNFGSAYGNLNLLAVIQLLSYFISVVSLAATMLCASILNAVDEPGFNDNILSDVFRRYDWNQSGTLSIEEMHAAMIEPGLNRQDIHRALQKMDFSDQFREFCHLQEIVKYRDFPTCRFLRLTTLLLLG